MTKPCQCDECKFDRAVERAAKRIIKVIEGQPLEVAYRVLAEITTGLVVAELEMRGQEGQSGTTH